jgi:S1-C subfamily serine protease
MRCPLRWTRSAALAASMAAAAALLVPAAAAGAGTSRAIRQEQPSSDEIAARADPAIVDVTSTTDNGRAAGSGIVLTSDGEILTNYHVVEGATSVKVTISNGSKSFAARVVGTDITDDVAVLKAQHASGLATLKAGKSARVAVGDRVIAIGNAFNRPGEPAVTVGTITAVGRSITVGGGPGGVQRLHDLLQTNAELVPGNSGGPLLNAAGDVIGVNTAAGTGRIRITGAGDGYAIPIDTAMTIVRQIESGRSTGNVHVGPRAILGVHIREAGSAFGSDSVAAGALVVGADPESAAASAGIVRGDRIVSIDGTDVGGVSDLIKAMNTKKPGDRVTVRWVDQAGQTRHATVQLAASDSA